VRGQKTVVIAGQDTVGKASGRLYVAATGQPYVLRMVIQGQTGLGTYNFSHFNQPVHPVAPRNAIDLDSLRAGVSG
jgi:hypothetical protein